MNNNNKAYTEVLEIIKYLPKEEFEKIPKEKIEFYKQNRDKEYKFNFDISKPLEEQNFLKETNAIIVTLFRDYFATEIQKEKLQKILLINEQKYQEDLRKKYNPDDIFKKQEKNYQEQKANTQLVEVKEENVIQKIFRKIINWIKSFI
ncbi:MAG: hypothetical protein ACI4UE_04555 [Candidatus Scatovivens sp.]